MFIIYPNQRERLHLMVHFSNESDPEGQYRFSPTDCAQTIELSRSFPAESGRVEGALEASQIRSATTHFIPHVKSTVWLYRKLMEAAVEANERYWNFDITGFFQPLQLVSYEGDTQQHYAWHLDIGPGADTGRKISISVQLSDAGDYQGGELEINSGKIITTPREAGAIVLFPSFVMHRVAPVTAGLRWALVGWVQGQQHFR